MLRLACLLLFFCSTILSQEVKLLSFNVYLCPEYTGISPHNEERSQEMLQSIVEFDILGLPEVYDYFMREKFKARLAQTHPYVVEPPTTGSLWQDGGITLFSRYPITFSKKIIYQNRTGSDIFVEKGAIFARIALPLGQKIEVAIKKLP